MAIHSIILVWRMPWIEEPGGLQSIRLQSDRQDRGDLVHTGTHMQTVPEIQLLKSKVIERQCLITYLLTYLFHIQFCFLVSFLTLHGK